MEGEPKFEELQENPPERDISGEVLQIINSDDKYKGEKLSEYVRSLRNEPEISITLDFDDLTKAEINPNWLKGFIEGSLGKKQKRSAVLRATEDQAKKPGVPNILASGVKWIKIDENGNEIK